MDGRAHELGKALRVYRGGHSDDAEVFAQLCQLQAHPEHQIRIQLALMDLIDGHGGHALELRILQQAAQQHARGDELDLAARAGFAADGEADILRGTAEGA